MKMIWVTLGLTTALVFGVIGLDAIVRRNMDQGALLIQNAEEAAVGHGDWPEASRLVSRAEAEWDACKNFHTFIFWEQTLDEIDLSFARLQVSLRMKDKQTAAEHFAVLCVKLKQASDNCKLSWDTVA